MLGYNKDQQVKKTKKRRKSASSERKRLIKHLDELIREIVFTKEDRCFVTGVRAGRFHPIDNPNGLQLSHFVTRTVFPLRWDLDNCHLTTASVNYTHENNQLPYTLAMLRVYGEQGLKTLQDKHDQYRQRCKTMTTVELRELYEKLKKLLPTTEVSETGM